MPPDGHGLPKMVRELHSTVMRAGDGSRDEEEKP